MMLCEYVLFQADYFKIVNVSEHDFEFTGSIFWKILLFIYRTLISLAWFCIVVNIDWARVDRGWGWLDGWVS